MKQIRPIEFWSTNRVYGLKIDEHLQERIRVFCRQSGGIETGGIIVGKYSEDQHCAHVTEVLGPTPDSRGGRNRFFRGVMGLNQILKRMWDQERHYRIGEWHYHPGSCPTPSSVDDDQMRAFANDERQKCPEPLMVILGGEPDGKWELGVFLYPEGIGPVELSPVEAK